MIRTLQGNSALDFLYFSIIDPRSSYEMKTPFIVYIFYFLCYFKFC